jgi:hypothetical protein
MTLSKAQMAAVVLASLAALNENQIPSKSG